MVVVVVVVVVATIRLRLRLRLRLSIQAQPFSLKGSPQWNPSASGVRHGRQRSEPIDVEELALQVARLPIQGEGIIGSRVGGGRHWLGDESRFEYPGSSVTSSGA